MSAGGYLALLLGTVDPPPCAVLSYYGYGTLDSPWYTKPSDHYRQAVPLVDDADALASVGEEVVVDSTASTISSSASTGSTTA